MWTVATLLETPRPLLDASTRQSIRQATSLADLVVLVRGDAVVPLDQTDSVDRLWVALMQSERSSAARRRRMEAAIAKSVDLRAQLKTIQVESATWQASALKTTEVKKSLKMSIFILETKAARLSAQRAYRLESAEKIFCSLYVAIQARDRDITCRTGRLAESRAQQAAVHGVATAYYCWSQEATMAMCNGGDHALRVDRVLIYDPRRAIVGLWNRIRHHRVLWLLDPSITTAAITGIEASGLNPRELNINSCLCRLLA